jgi:UDP-2-acetamido-2,6-beta-L-arabino-hexul-4-ose reductase
MPPYIDAQIGAGGKWEVSAVPDSEARQGVVVGITGSSGLLGRHLSAALVADGRHKIRRADRAVFSDNAALGRFVTGCDVIVHFAGMTRGEAGDVERTNIALARELATALEQEGCSSTVVFANSPQRDEDNAYGRSKREGAEMLGSWAASSGGGLVDLVIPNAFGEGGRPHHNSFVSTFCSQLARSEEPHIIVDAEVELVHAQQVAQTVLGVVIDHLSWRGRSVVRRLEGERHLVSDILGRLRGYLEPYVSGIVPALPDAIDLPLFNTLRSFVFDVRPVISLPRHADTRGYLVEVAKSYGQGQTFYSLTHPGVERGKHFHLRKLERFVVLDGTAVIKVRHLFTDKVMTFEVSGDVPVAIDMPTLSTHSIVNTGATELLTMFWASEIFDPEDPDTFPEPVDP